MYTYTKKLVLWQYVQMGNLYQTNRVHTVLVIVKTAHLATSWQGCVITDVLITGMESTAIVWMNNSYNLCQLFPLFLFCVFMLQFIWTSLGGGCCSHQSRHLSRWYGTVGNIDVFNSTLWSKSLHIRRHSNQLHKSFK